MKYYKRVIKLLVLIPLIYLIVIVGGWVDVHLNLYNQALYGIAAGMVLIVWFISFMWGLK